MLLLVSGLMALILAPAVTGWFTYRSQRNWLLDISRRATLSSTRNRADEVRAWRDARLAEAGALASNDQFISLSRNLLLDANDSNAGEAWDQMTAILLTRPDYRCAILLDSDGALRRSVGNPARHLVGADGRFAGKIPEGNSPQLFDPQPSAGGGSWMVLAIPLIKATPDSHGLRPFVAVEIDSRPEFSGKIRGRPAPGTNTESLLVRRQSDGVTVLDSPGTPTVPPAGAMIPASKSGSVVHRVLEGKEGVFDGIDFRGNPNVMAVHRVGQTEWWIVTTIPTASILVQARREAWRFGGLAGVLTLAVAAIFLLALQRRQSSLYRRLYEEQTRREALVESFDHLTRFANDVIILTDGQEKILEVNERALETYGYSRDELIGKPLGSLSSTGKPGTDQADTARLKASSHFEYFAEHIRKNGDRFPVEVRAHYFERGERSFIHRIIRDVTERFDMERRLRDSAENYRRLFEGANDAIVVADAESGLILDVNGKVTVLTGRTAEELRGAHHTILHPKDIESRSRRNFRSRAQEDRLDTIETELVHVSGRRIPVEVNASRIELQGRPAVFGIFRDISERLRAKEELQSSEMKRQKLESLALLAGGIAHDFNNLLTAILGNISVARHGSMSHSDLDNCLAEAERGSMRAKDLTHQLLTFSKGGAPIKTVLDIGRVLRETASFACRGSAIQFYLEVPETPITIEADEGQISQVINNIAINAVQAMPAGGVFTASATIVQLGQDNAQKLPPGQYAQIRMADTGSGIPAELLQRIFDPYFTTKQQGSGLGLAISHSIVLRHGGHLSVKSKLGAGTTFEVLLPASDAPLPSSIRTDVLPVSPGGRVLVMDDEPLVFELALRMLSHLGFEGIGASDGTEALRLYKEAHESGHPFDAVIMDLTIIGGMGGKDAIAALLDFDPKVRAVVSSGYSNDPIMSNYRDFGFKAVLTKPYKISEMQSVLASVLNP